MSSWIRGGLRVAVAVITLGVVAAGANERHFTYTYESAVLPPGEREMELWSTYRTGRHDHYVRLDQRVELEFGVTEGLMSSFYLNWSDVAAEDPSTTPPSVRRQLEYGGISSEWKIKLSDPVADRFGSALYAELSLGTEEVEWEGKLILDKRSGPYLAAYNLTVEPEWEIAPGEVELEEVGIEQDVAVTRFLRPATAVGLEYRNHVELTAEHKPEHVAHFLGPVVSHVEDRWWVACTALAQLPALKASAEDPRSTLVLDEHERYSARLLLSFAF